MTQTIHEFPTASEASNAALVSDWRQAREDLGEAKARLGRAEKNLAERAKATRGDFLSPFREDGQHSRTVTIDGASEGKVLVSCVADFAIAKDVGEIAKRGIEGYTKRFQKRMINEYGEEVIEDIELIAVIRDIIGGRAALSKAAVIRLQAIPLTAKHPKPLRDAIDMATNALQPLKSKVTVKEVK